MIGKTARSLVLACLLLTTVGLPAASAGTDDVDRASQGPVGCIVDHLKNGWFVGNCLSEAQSSGGPGETLDCVYEHLKNDWFVGNCL